MNTITLQHYKNDQHLASGTYLSHEHPLHVAEIAVTKTHGMDGQSGTARTVGGEEMPVSRLFQQGYDRRWVSCINDDTGERWA